MDDDLEGAEICARGERASLAPRAANAKSSTSVLPCLFLTAILAAATAVAGVAGAALAAASTALQPTPAMAASTSGSAAASGTNYTAIAALDATGAWVVQDVRRIRFADGRLVTASPPLTWADAIDALCDGSLGPFLSQRLSASPHAAALYWETPPMSKRTLSRAFQFATLPAPHLARARSDAGAFAAHFRAAAPCATATFASLGGDATLVAPCPPAGVGAAAAHAPTHAHLGAFVRLAPAAQRDALWRAVGAAAREAAAKSEPTWVSTEGSGVPWLHVRLDTRPKYYHHSEYLTHDGGAGA